AKQVAEAREKAAADAKAAKAADDARAKAAVEAKAKAASEAKAAAQAKAAADAKAAAAAEERRLAAIKRMQGLASGSDEGSGSQKSSGPSPGYAGRVQAKVRPNIVFPDAGFITGNPKAEVEVRTTPDGQITSAKLVKSSGNAAWDQAALRAINKTSQMPKDVDGRIPTPMIVELRPKP
ncbi:MAG: cell envelope integrity protein TolA, partial [Burkholderiaceae bacterium]